MTDKAPPQLQFIDTLPPQLRLALSRYKLRRSLNQPASVEDDPDLQRLLELEKAWNASLPQPAATLPETASTSQPPEPAAPRPPQAVAAMPAVPRQDDHPAISRPAPASARKARQATSGSGFSLQERDLGPVATAALSAGQQLLRAWWARHPARMALTIGTPLLTRYAKRKPLQVLALAAAVGAAVVVLRPWRWNRTRLLARSSVNREIRRLRLSSLWGMVTDSLLRNGKSN